MYNYLESLEQVDWTAFKSILAQDNFDNGRTPEQLKLSYSNSAHVIFVYHENDIIGSARALSDGVCNAYLIDVWTYSPYRKQGVATQMIKLLKSKVTGQHLSLFTDNPSFYKHLNFEIEPTGMSCVVGTWLKK